VAIEPSGFSIDWVSEVVLTVAAMPAGPGVEVLSSHPQEPLPETEMNPEAKIFLRISELILFATG